MDTYAVHVERKMKRFFDWLSEKGRRRYAAVEARPFVACCDNIGRKFHLARGT